LIPDLRYRGLKHILANPVLLGPVAKLVRLARVDALPVRVARLALSSAIGISNVE